MKRKAILYFILILMVVSGSGIGYYYWYQNANYIVTDDARVSGDIYRVMPRIAGKLTALNIDDGSSVVADQIVGQQDTTNLSTSLLDNSTLRSPITGTVIKTLAKVGEVVSPGQPVGLVVDKNQLYISANIEETDVGRVKVGQPVDFTIDSFTGYTLEGKITEVGEATNSTFALLPATNTSGNFTKVTQRIPIKASLDNKPGLPLSPGMNVVLRIHVKGK